MEEESGVVRRLIDGGEHTELVVCMQAVARLAMIAQLHKHLGKRRCLSRSLQ